MSQRRRYWLFRSWGRVGTTIGDNKLESMDDRGEAVERFVALYEEKTGNAWKNRHQFIKQPGKFYPLDIDYGTPTLLLLPLSFTRPLASDGT